jgi:hypothetical protein
MGLHASGDKAPPHPPYQIMIRFIKSKFITDMYVTYSLPNILRVVKSSRIRWAGHVARMGEDRGVHRVLVGKP